MRQASDYTNQRFGSYIVKRRVQKKPGSVDIRWECQCDCGNTIIKASKKLRDMVNSIKQLNETIGMQLFNLEDLNTDCGCGDANKKKLKKKKLYDLIVRYDLMKKQVDELYKKDLETLEKMKIEIEEMKNVFVSA
jgi:hypothetical protein